MLNISYVSNGFTPRYMTEGASGIDLCAAIDQVVLILPHETTLIATGFWIALPDGYEAQIRPRSGISVQHALIIPNAPGTIDSDYRGEVKIPVRNIGSALFVVYPQERIAQMIIAKIAQAKFVQRDRLPPTARNSGGFGSTGFK